MAFKLRDYQEKIAYKGLSILYEHNLVYLALEVRVGKTFTAFAIANNHTEVTSVLFVTKKKAIGGIKKDYELMNPHFDCEFINYESLHKIDGHYDLVIIDECQALSQFPVKTKRTKLLKELCHNLPIIYLSGTPNPESYSQLYHQFWVSSFSPFAEYKTFYKWAKEFVNVKQKYLYGQPINDYSDAKKDMVLDAIDHVMITFSQKDAGFKQYVEEEILRVKMHPNLFKLIDILEKKNIYHLKNGDTILAETPVKLMSKIHQISSGTVKTEEGNYRILDTSKAEFIKEHFAGKKISIFYKFIAEGNLLRKTFDNHTDDPMEFNESIDKVFISQVVSGREGINLSTADCLVFYNIDFSSLSYWQSRARLLTKDREKAAKIYWIFSDKGIEPKVHAAVSRKKNYTLAYFKREYGRKKPRKKDPQLFD